MGELPVVGDAVAVPVDADRPVPGVSAEAVDILQLVVVELALGDSTVIVGVLLSRDRIQQPRDERAVELGIGSLLFRAPVEVEAEVVDLLGRLPRDPHRIAIAGSTEVHQVHRRGADEADGGAGDGEQVLEQEDVGLDQVLNGGR